jgi:hypothetical protein
LRTEHRASEKQGSGLAKGAHKQGQNDNLSAVYGNRTEIVRLTRGRFWGSLDLQLQMTYNWSSLAFRVSHCSP